MYGYTYSYLNIHNIIYSHLHADQTHGINDLRIFFHKNKKKIDVYANKATKKYLQNNFSYCFKKQRNYQSTLKLNLINITSYSILISQRVRFPLNVYIVYFQLEFLNHLQQIYYILDF